MTKRTKKFPVEAARAVEQVATAPVKRMIATTPIVDEEPGRVAALEIIGKLIDGWRGQPFNAASSTVLAIASVVGIKEPMKTDILDNGLLLTTISMRMAQAAAMLMNGSNISSATVIETIKRVLEDATTNQE